MQTLRLWFGFGQKDKKQRTAERIVELKAKKREEEGKKQEKTEELKVSVCKKKDAEYSEEIYKYLRRVERVFTTKASYLEHRENFRIGNRQAAVEWMADIQASLELKRESLFTGASLFDRYVELVGPEDSELGLLALTCLFVGYKYEEVAYLYKEVLALRTFQGELFEPEAVYNYEMKVLTSLGWRLSHLGPMSFFDLLAAYSPRSKESQKLAAALSDSLLMTGFITKQQSSLIGSAIFWITLKLDGDAKWSAEFSAKSLYTEQMIKACASELLEFLKAEKQRLKGSASFTRTSFKVEQTLDMLCQLENSRGVLLCLLLSQF